MFTYFNYTYTNMSREAEEEIFIGDKGDYLALYDWDMYILTPNEHDSHPAEYKRKLEPYVERINISLLQDEIQASYGDYDNDRLRKLRYGVKKGEPLKKYEKTVIILLLMMNFKIWNQVTVHNLSDRISQFIIRSPSVIYKLIGGIKEWFRAEDYGVATIESQQNSQNLEVRYPLKELFPQEMASLTVKAKTMVSAMTRSYNDWMDGLLIPFKNRETQRLLQHQDENNVEQELNEMERRRKDATERLAAALGRKKELVSRIRTFRERLQKK